MHQLESRTNCRLNCFETRIKCQLNTTTIELNSKIEELVTKIDGATGDIDSKVKHAVDGYMSDNGEDLVADVIVKAGQKDKSDVKSAIQDIVADTMAVIAVQDGGGANGYEDDGYNKDYNGDG